MLNNYYEIKEDLGILLSTWEIKGTSKKEAYNDKYYRMKKENPDHSAGNPFTHDINQYDIEKSEGWGIRTPLTKYIDEWYRDKDYILMMLDCDFNKFGGIPQEEKERAVKELNAIIPTGYKAIQRKKGLEEQFHAFCWVEKSILGHMKGVQFKVMLGDERATADVTKLKASELEIFVAGKFLRCGGDYIGELDLYNLPHITKDRFLEISKGWKYANNNNIFQSLPKAKAIKKASEYNKIDISDLKTSSSDKEIIERILKLGKPSYDDAKQIVIALGQRNKESIFLATIPKEKHHEYIGLFEKAHNGEFPGVNLRIHRLIYGALEEEQGVRFKLGASEKLGNHKEAMKFLSNLKNRTTYLLHGGCGIGKTTMLSKKLAYKYDFPLLLLSPGTGLQKQVVEEHANCIGIGGSYPTFNKIKDELQPGEIGVLCFEALKDAKPEDLEGFGLIIDEVHTMPDHASFRPLLFLTDLIKKAKFTLLMTATPYDLPQIWDEKITIDGGQKFPIDMTRIMGPAGKMLTKGQKYATFNKLKENCKNHKIPLLVICDQKLGIKEEYTGMKITRSKDKLNCPNYLSIVIDGVMKDLSGFTMLLNEGVSVNNPGRVAVWVDIEPVATRLSTIIQLGQRFRKASMISMYFVDKQPKRWNYSDVQIWEDIEKKVACFNDPKKMFDAIAKDSSMTILKFLQIKEGVFSFKDPLFPVYRSLINGEAGATKKTLEKVSNVMGWKLKETEVAEFLEEEEEEAEKKIQPKAVHRKIFLDKNKKLVPGSERLIKLLALNKKPLNDATMKEHYADLLSRYYALISDKKVYDKLNFKILEWKKDRTKSYEDHLKDYFRVNKDFTFQPSPELKIKLLGDNMYYLDTRRYSRTQKETEEVLGAVYTIGQHAKNEKLTRHILKELGFKVKKQEKVLIIYENVVIGNRGTKEYKASKLLEKEILKKAKDQTL